MERGNVGCFVRITQEIFRHLENAVSYSVKIDKIKQIVGLQNRFLAHLSLDRFPLRC